MFDFILHFVIFIALLVSSLGAMIIALGVVKSCYDVYKQKREGNKEQK